MSRVCGRKVHAVGRSYHLLDLRGSDVLYISRGLNLRCMPRLSVKLQRACGERSFDELHLQRRINGAEWRPVCSVHGRKVQVVDRSCHLSHLSVKLQLACGELSFDKLRVETCIFIMGLFLILHVRSARYEKILLSLFFILSSIGVLS